MPGFTSTGGARSVSTPKVSTPKATPKTSPPKSNYKSGAANDSVKAPVVIPFFDDDDEIETEALVEEPEPQPENDNGSFAAGLLTGLALGVILFVALIIKALRGDRR